MSGDLTLESTSVPGLLVLRLPVHSDYVIVARIFWLRMRQGDNAEPSMEPSPTVTLR